MNLGTLSQTWTVVSHRWYYVFQRVNATKLRRPDGVAADTSSGYARLCLLLQSLSEWVEQCPGEDWLACMKRWWGSYPWRENGNLFHEYYSPNENKPRSLTSLSLAESVRKDEAVALGVWGVERRSWRNGGMTKASES